MTERRRASLDFRSTWLEPDYISVQLILHQRCSSHFFWNRDWVDLCARERGLEEGKKVGVSYHNKLATNHPRQCWTFNFTLIAWNSTCRKPGYLRVPSTPPRYLTQRSTENAWSCTDVTPTSLRCIGWRSKWHQSRRFPKSRDIVLGQDSHHHQCV